MMTMSRCETPPPVADHGQRCLHTAHQHVTRDEYEIQFSDIFDQINAYVAGHPINVVNPQVFDVLKDRRTS